jgi:hypothetical protein
MAKGNSIHPGDQYEVLASKIKHGSCVDESSAVLTLWGAGSVHGAGRAAHQSLAKPYIYLAPSRICFFQPLTSTKQISPHFFSRRKPAIMALRFSSQVPEFVEAAEHSPIGPGSLPGEIQLKVLRQVLVCSDAVN